MKLPFSTEDFFRVMKAYNLVVYPSQFLLLLLALVVLVVCIRGKRNAGKIVLGVLGYLWLWMGILYHWLFFTQINKAAYGFSALFIIQGFLFLHEAFWKNHTFAIRANLRSLAAIALVSYALLIYPSIGYLAGHVYPSAPTFGLPCPTTIYTFGILLFAGSRLPRYLFVIPFIWAFIGFSAALTMNVYEDTGLMAAAVIFAALMLVSGRKRHYARRREPATSRH